MRLRVFVAHAVMGFGACGPSVEQQEPVELPSEEGEQYARSLCQAVESCGCGQPFDSTSACETEYHNRFDKLLEVGLGIVPDCFESWRANISADPCQDEHAEPGAPLSCAQLRGRKGKDAVCEAHLGLPTLVIDECDQGLTCRDARCINAPSTNQGTFTELAEGEACGPTYQGVCRGAHDMYCDLTESVCRTTVALGAACTSNGACTSCTTSSEQRAYCERPGSEGQGVCTPAPGLGAPCDPLDSVGCGGCDGSAWCDPVSETCVEGQVPLLCAQVLSTARQ